MDLHLPWGHLHHQSSCDSEVFLLGKRPSIADANSSMVSDKALARMRWKGHGVDLKRCSSHVAAAAGFEVQHRTRALVVRRYLCRIATENPSRLLLFYLDYRRSRESTTRVTFSGGRWRLCAVPVRSSLRTFFL